MGLDVKSETTQLEEIGLARLSGTGFVFNEKHSFLESYLLPNTRRYIYVV